MDDAELVSAAQGGDQSAFCTLVQRYRAYVYTIAYKIVLHEEDALDVTQEVFMRAAQEMRSYSGRGSFKSWLAACAAKASISEQRKWARREQIAPRAELDDEQWQRLQSTNGPQRSESINARDAVERDWQRSRLDDAMKSLSPQQRAILALHLREEFSTREIAQHLSVGESQVRTQLARAVQRLRAIVSEQQTGTGSQGGNKRE